jgi:hypothetical protein
MRNFTAVFAAMALAVGGAACSDSPSSPSLSGGNFTLRMRDTPFTEAKAVLVTFSSVRAHRSESDWTVVPFINAATTRTCDLKQLETSEDVLGTASLPTGHYTQVRLVVQSATIFFDNASSGSACATTIAPPAGASSALDIPSGEVRLIRGFDVTSDSTMTMLIDFDGDQSIRQTGNNRYMMTPVITVLSVS